MRHALAPLALALPLLLAGPPAPAQEAAPVSLELNKLEDQSGNCRVYLVFNNKSAEGYEGLKLDLVLFGQDGVVSRRLALEAGPLRAAKTTVKLFEVAGLPCPAIGQVLLNDVTDCKSAGKEIADCLPRLAVNSRTSVPLVK
ncbi:MAG: hypothetical protein OHK0024_25470 [Thalassobaculales bacterium]